MITQILTGAGIGIFTGYSLALCSGILALLTFCGGAVAGYLLDLRLKEHKSGVFAAVFLLVLCRAALFWYPVPEAVPLICGLLSGVLFHTNASSGAVLKSALVSGLLSTACATLFVTGSGEAALAFICGGAAAASGFFKKNELRKYGSAVLAVVLLSIFPAGTLSKYERMKETDLAMKLQRGVCGAMILPGKAVATKALIVGSFSRETAEVLNSFPGLEKVDVVKHYMQLYPVFARGEKREQYPVVLVNGNGRLCRLASSLVAPDGVIVVPENCVPDVPQAFRHWSELPSSPGFIAMARDFVIDCSEDAFSRKMEQHIKRLGLQKTIPAGVCDALFSPAIRPSAGIRELESGKQINYTLWFFGLMSGVYLILRLIVFSRFDKGERRWSALENTASTVLLLLLLKRFPDTLCTALLPSAVFLMLPVLKLTGSKCRLLQLAGAALCISSIFSMKFLNAAQLVGVICCGVMWHQLRKEKNAVTEWVDFCSLAGFFLGVAVFMLLMTASAPAIFILGTVLLLRSNILFRSL